MSRMYSLGDTLSRLRRKKMFEDIERIIVETEEGEEIATIINDDEIDEAIIVANGYTVRIKPKAN